MLTEKELLEDLKRSLYNQTKVQRTRDYLEFKKTFLPRHLTLYEKLCNQAASIIKINIDSKKRKEISKFLEVSHLATTPDGVISFAILFPLLFMIFGSILGFLVPFILSGKVILFFVIFFFIVGLVMIYPLMELPKYFANRWRMKSTNQMIETIFYVATYMRHTANLELAIEFASKHILPPLALDLKKILWDVETEHFKNIKDALDNYLESWREWNMEFVESFHLIEASLYEPTEDRRLNLIEKAMSVILEETYEKMLRYAHNLKAPLNILFMLGIILPILSLVILPLAINFLGSIAWYHIATLYDVALLMLVYIKSKAILSTRPTGYGDTNLGDFSELRKYKNFIIHLGKIDIKISPFIISIIILFGLILLSFTPLFAKHLVKPINLKESTASELMIWGYIKQGNIIKGPYGLLSFIFGLLFPLSIALSVGIYFRTKSKKLIKIREKIKKLEKEFASALYQLGNRLSDGIPVELAFQRVAYIMKGTLSGEFFRIATVNMFNLGMSAEDAIFDKKRGALMFFPSKIIQSSMEILIESTKKGPQVAARAMVDVARYIRDIHRVNERLKDLLGDVVSNIKTQIKFIMPVISAIVVSINSMIITILLLLQNKMQSLTNNSKGLQQVGALGGVFDMLKPSIPAYYFQIIVGVYVVGLVYILSVLANNIENGEDKLNEQYEISKNMLATGFIYTITALILSVMFNILAMQILKSFT